MKRPVILGLVFIVAGVACIFPFIRALVFENIMIMLGIYLTYRGYLYLTTPEQTSDDKKNSTEPILPDKNNSCQPDCKK